MRETLFTPEAERDLGEIWEYIAKDSPDAASAFVDRIETEILQLAEFPGIGHYREDVADRRYRFWRVKSFLVAYRFDATSLLVVRVVHGARDFRVIFGSS